MNFRVDLIAQLELVGVEQLEKNSAVFDQVVSDLTGPEDLDKKAPMAIAVVLAGNEDANLLSLQAPCADQADAGWRNVSTEELNLPVIGRKDFGGLDKGDPAVLTALAFGCFHLVFANDLSDRLLNIALVSWSWRGWVLTTDT